MIREKDIAMIILVVSISLMVSYFLGNALINTDQNRSVEVEVVQPISADFDQPSPQVFSSNAINPTELIQIGSGDTDSPFQSGENQ